MISFVLLVFVWDVAAQTEVACELFNYTATTFASATTGGVGWRSVAWQQITTPCEGVGFTNLTRFPFVLYSSVSDSLMIGTTSTTAYCAMFRSMTMPPVPSSAGVLYVSALFVSNPTGGWGSNREFAFGVALANQNGAKDWQFASSMLTSDDSDCVAISGFRRSAASGPISVSTSVSTSPATDFSWGAAVSMFLVMRIEWTELRRGVLRYYLYDTISSADQVSESNLASAPSFAVTVNADKLNTLSLAMFKCHVAQVRVGKTFASVYSDLPSFLQRATTATATANRTPAATTISTAVTSSGSTVMATPKPAPSMSPKSTPTTPLSFPNASPLTTTTTTATTTATTTPATVGSNSNSGALCDGALSCGGCVGQQGCKWCSTGLATTNSRCVGGQDSGDGCDRLTLSLSGCEAPAANQQTNDELSSSSSPLPVAIIGGAVGGGVAALLLIAAVIFCVARSRSRRGGMPAAEMTTARESNSMIPSDMGTSHYGDIRLANVYSSGGLTPAAGNSLASGSYYMTMEMNNQ
jgi:hypothetical protein